MKKDPARNVSSKVNKGKTCDAPTPPPTQGDGDDGAQARRRTNDFDHIRAPLAEEFERLQREKAAAKQGAEGNDAGNEEGQDTDESTTHDHDDDAGSEREA